MKTRVVVVLGVLAFCSTLAVMIAQRLSGEAMAVLLGVIAGVGASIPTSLIVVWLTVRNMTPTRRTIDVRPPRESADAGTTLRSERVVVVQAPGNAAPTSSMYGGVARADALHTGTQPPFTPRQFTVIGGASESDGAAAYPGQRPEEEAIWLR